MTENKKIGVMLIVVTILTSFMATAMYIGKPTIISSDNKLIQECLAKKLSCSIYSSSRYGLSYAVDIDGFEKRMMETEQEALEFIKKVESFNNIKDKLYD